VIERDRFSVFIDHAAPDVWQITGTFTHARSGSGGTVALQSGRLLYDAVADVVVDTHPGPHPTDSAGVLCASLA
jgi:hypothetical protein